MEAQVPDFTPQQPKPVAQFVVNLLANGQAQVGGPLDNAKLCMAACQAILQTSLDVQMKKAQSSLVLPVGTIRNKDFRNGQ